MLKHEGQGNELVCFIFSYSLGYKNREQEFPKFFRPKTEFITCTTFTLPSSWRASKKSVKNNFNPSKRLAFSTIY